MIRNFRRLENVVMDIESNETVFVGPNNSGKTSAMVALRRFLVEREDFSINDITLTHWAQLDAVGASWEKATAGEEAEPFVTESLDARCKHPRASSSATHSHHCR